MFRHASAFIDHRLMDMEFVATFNMAMVAIAMLIVGPTELAGQNNCMLGGQARVIRMSRGWQNDQNRGSGCFGEI